MALEDVLVFFQFLYHGGQGRVNHHEGRLRRLEFAIAFSQIADRYVVLLRFNIKQVVDRDAEVVSTDVGVVDGDGDVFLLLRRVAKKSLHPLSQASVVLYAYGHHGDDDTDNQCPIKEQEESPNVDRTMEKEGEQEEVADGDEEYQSQHGTSVMPNAPRLDAQGQRF